LKENIEENLELQEQDENFGEIDDEPENFIEQEIRIFKNNQRNRFYFLPFNFESKGEQEIILHFYLDDKEIFTKNLILDI
jgi:hypothetical protein